MPRPFPLPPLPPSPVAPRPHPHRNADGHAITLLMMAAVVDLFANLTGSIRNRRALHRALRPAPPGPPAAGPRPRRLHRHPRPRRPPPPGGRCTRAKPSATSRHRRRRPPATRPSRFVDGRTGNGEIDYATSLVPSGGDPAILLPQQVTSDRDGDPALCENDVTNGGGLGDSDDILAMTVRSLADPFTAEVEIPS